MYVSWSVFVSLFLSEYLSQCSAMVYRYVFWSASLCVSLSLSLSQCPGLIAVICVYVNKRDQLAQRVIAVYKIQFFVFSFACIRTSLDLCFFLPLSYWISVPVFGYILTHCMSIHVSGSCLFLSFSLNICSTDRLYYYWLHVYMSFSWSVFLSFFLFQCLYQCSAILSLIVIL